MSSQHDPDATGARERDPAADAAPPSQERRDTGAADTPAPAGRREGAAAADRSGNMLPGRARRRFGIERLFVRLVATCGIVAIGVLLGAILVSSKVQGWITGLVVAAVSVVLAGMLWSSRQL